MTMIVFQRSTPNGTQGVWCVDETDGDLHLCEDFEHARRVYDRIAADAPTEGPTP